MEGTNEHSNRTCQELQTSGSAFKILKTNYDPTPFISRLTFKGRHLIFSQHVMVVPGHDSSLGLRKH